jgi:hypothetical protein
MKNNYEKILIAVAAVVALVLIVFAFLKVKSVEENFTDADETRRSADQINAELPVSQAALTLTDPMTLEPVVVGADREVGSFTGINLFVRKGQDSPVDLLASEEPPVHPPIPNIWWIENGIDPGFGDSPQRDHDEDGFSNLEEYEAGTDTADADSFPSLFNKIQVASVEEEQWYLRFSDFGGGNLSFKIEGLQDGQKVENRMGAGAAVAPNAMFFEDEPYANRFKYLGTVQKETDSGIEKSFARIEDLKPGKEGTIYEYPSGSHKTLESDYTARLYLDTPDQRDNEFTVPEGPDFALPYDPDAEEKPYLLKEIGNNGQTLLLLWNDDGEEKELRLNVPG